jgi:TnsA endonuclease-like protein
LLASSDINGDLKMAKTRRTARAQRTSTSKIRKGGNGRGQDYEPHIRVQNVPSKGRVSRAKGSKTGRPHHCLSKLEWYFFLILEWSLIVIDIREQYALDVEETVAIAAILGIRHPIDNKTKKPRPLTTDFVITVKSSKGTVDQARTVKYVKDLPSKRVMEKFEIERIYWERRGIDWGIVTEKEIDFTFAANIEKVYYYRDAARLSPLSEETIRCLKSELTSRAIRKNIPLRDIAHDCEKLLKLPAGTSSKVILHLVANRIWLVDMSTPLQMTKPIVFTSQPTLDQIKG